MKPFYNRITVLQPYQGSATGKSELRLSHRFYSITGNRLVCKYAAIPPKIKLPARFHRSVVVVPLENHDDPVL